MFKVGKTRKSLSFILSLALIFGMLPFAVMTASATGSGIDGSSTITQGSGTEKDPYIIKDVAGLRELADRVNATGAYSGEPFYQKWFKLDKDFNNENDPITTPIGNTGNHPFFGNLDGSNAEVTLKINQPEEANLGLFGWVGFAYMDNPSGYTKVNQTFKNIKISGNITGDYYVAGLIAHARQIDTLTLENCTNSCTIDADNCVAGLIAHSEDVTNVNITKCTNTANIHGDPETGGIAGLLMRSNVTVKDCINSGSVTNSVNLISKDNGGMGGIVGKCTGNFTAINCHNKGDIFSNTPNLSPAFSPASMIGGIVGDIASSNETKILNCSSIGKMSDFNKSGGIAGNINCSGKADIINCYSVGEISVPSSFCAGICALFNPSGGGGIVNCYHTGTLTVENGTDPYYSTPFGICSYLDSDSTLKNCYYETGQGASQANQGKTDNEFDSVEELTNDKMLGKTKGDLLGKLNEYVDEHPTIGEGEDAISLSEWVIKDEENSGYPEFGERNAIEEAEVNLAIDAPQAGQKLAENANVDTLSSIPENKVDATTDNIKWIQDGSDIANFAKCGEMYIANFNVNLSVNDMNYKLTNNTKLKATVNGQEAKVDFIKKGIYSVSYTFKRVQHVWDSGRVVENPTVEKEGTLLYTCTVCNSGTKTEAIEKLKEEVKPVTKTKQKIKFLDVSSLTRIFKASDLKRSRQRFAIVANANTKLTYTKVKGSKRLRLNKKLGNVIVKKGTKAGSYKIRVRITAQETENYKKAKITKIIRVIVK